MDTEERDNTNENNNSDLVTPVRSDMYDNHPKEKHLLLYPIGRGQKRSKSISTVDIVNEDILISFENHPFKLYEGQRLDDMVESVRKSGVIVPIVVRPHHKEEGKYEILSGHNRVAAAKAAGVTEIPAIIYKGLTDEEALLIVTETNLIQRSFSDLRHSEKAIALATQYDALKKNPGYRSDLIDEIDNLTGAPVGHRSRTRDEVGSHYALGKTTVARYLRINKLIVALKDRLDNDVFGMRVAEALSFLKIDEQEIIEEFLSGEKKINISLANALKTASEKGTLSKTEIEKMFEEGNSTSTKRKTMKLSNKILSTYFNEDQSEEDIERIIAEALTQYRSTGGL